MDENEKEKNREAEELTGKNVAFYETFLSAWVENRMEVDKQLLTLSSLAIGLLMTFKLGTVTELVLWLVSGGLFLITIVVVLCVFRNNTKYIECLISDDDENKKKAVEKSLQTLTAWAFVMFILAIASTFVLALIKSGFVITKATGG
jgi:hypothetical protein